MIICLYLCDGPRFCYSTVCFRNWNCFLVGEGVRSTPRIDAARVGRSIGDAWCGAAATDWLLGRWCGDGRTLLQILFVFVVFRVCGRWSRHNVGSSFSRVCLAVLAVTWNLLMVGVLLFRLTFFTNSLKVGCLNWIRVGRFAIFMLVPCDLNGNKSGKKRFERNENGDQTSRSRDTNWIGVCEAARNYCAT